MSQNQKQKSLLALLLFVVLLLPGCDALNPLCGSARPKPVLISLDPNSATLSQIQEGLVLTITGSKFYADSVIVWNGVVLPTAVLSASQLQATITATEMSSPGTAKVAVHTPGNLSGDLGCDSGGNSKTLTFTVT